MTKKNRRLGVKKSKRGGEAVTSRGEKKKRRSSLNGEVGEKRCSISNGKQYVFSEVFLVKCERKGLKNRQERKQKEENPA